MSHRNLALGTAAILVFAVTLLAFYFASYSVLETINPIAALTALTVAIVGFVWFKKTR